jgi:hypothetical protein
MRLEQTATLLCEHHDRVAVAVETLHSDEPLFAQVSEIAGPRIGYAPIVVPEVARRHHAKRAHRRERAAFGPTKRVTRVLGHERSAARGGAAG